MLMIVTVNPKALIIVRKTNKHTVVVSEFSPIGYLREENFNFGIILSLQLIEKPKLKIWRFFTHRFGYMAQRPKRYQCISFPSKAAMVLLNRCK
jgi:hypothetical protein